MHPVSPKPWSFLHQSIHLGESITSSLPGSQKTPGNDAGEMDTAAAAPQIICSLQDAHGWGNGDREGLSIVLRGRAEGLFLSPGAPARAPMAAQGHPRCGELGLEEQLRNAGGI